MTGLIQPTKKRQALIMGCFWQLVVIALLGLCFLLALRFVAPTPWNNYRVDASTKLIPFEDPSLDFVISYPVGWQALATPQGILEGQSRDTSVKALIGPATPTGPSVTVRLQSLIPGTTPEEIEVARRQSFKSKLDFQVLSLKRSLLYGIPALVAEYTWAEEISLLNTQWRARARSVYLIRGEQVYIIEFRVREDDYPPLEARFTQMTDSFRFRR